MLGAPIETPPRVATMASGAIPNDDWHPHVFRMPDWVEPVVSSKRLVLLPAAAC